MSKCAHQNVPVKRGKFNDKRPIYTSNGYALIPTFISTYYQHQPRQNMQLITCIQIKKWQATEKKPSDQSSRGTWMNENERNGRLKYYI